MTVLFSKKCDIQANSFQVSLDIFVALEFMSVNQVILSTAIACLTDM